MCCYRSFGHYFVEGVGYATIQAILNGRGATALASSAFCSSCKLLATSISLGVGLVGRHFLAVAVHGLDARRRLRRAGRRDAPAGLAISVPAFAMVGMGAMVGGATGAAMTAVTMIFEMTRDYHIVLPMILAVAAALGVRRMLSRENIYTAETGRAAATRSPRRCTPTCSWCARRRT